MCQWLFATCQWLTLFCFTIIPYTKQQYLSAGASRFSFGISLVLLSLPFLVWYFFFITPSSEQPCLNHSPLFSSLCFWNISFLYLSISPRFVLSVCCSFETFLPSSSFSDIMTLFPLSLGGDSGLSLSSAHIAVHRVAHISVYIQLPVYTVVYIRVYKHKNKPWKFLSSLSIFFPGNGYNNIKILILNHKLD